METRTYCRGYMKINNYKSWYDENWKLNVRAEFNYTTKTTQDCFDINGEKLGVFKTEKYHTKDEVQILDTIEKTVIQYGFDFFKIDTNESLNADAIDGFRVCLSNSNRGKFYVKYCDDYARSSKDKRDEFAELTEINVNGTSRNICKNLGKSFFEVDLNKYKSNLERFVKENNDWYGERAEYLYKANIKNLCHFFLCSEKELFKANFTDKLLKRLHYNINNKQ